MASVLQSGRTCRPLDTGTQSHTGFLNSFSPDESAHCQTIPGNDCETQDGPRTMLAPCPQLGQLGVRVLGGSWPQSQEQSWLSLIYCLQAMHAGFDFSRARIAIDLWLVTDLLPYM